MSYPPGIEPGLTSRNDLTVEVASPVMAVLGLPATFGEEFPCILPGYEGTLSSIIEPGSLRYETLYTGAPRHYLSLAEVFASRVAGRIVVLERQRASHHRWWQRAKYTAGLIDVTPARLNLPERLSRAAHRLANGYALALALSETERPGEPIAFAKRFAMDWCRLPERAACEGLRELRDAGVLVEAGSLDNPGQRPTPLYHPNPLYFDTTTTLQETHA